MKGRKAMFCSKCGKTIHAADAVCPHCQAPIGDNRFGGIPYTSAQFTIAPGQTTFEPLNNYTKTTYTSMKDAAQEGGEVDSRTTYRPVYEGASAPESVRRDMRAAVSAAGEEEEAQPEPREEAQPLPPDSPIAQAARETLEELDEELQPDEEIDMEQFRSRPIQSTGRAGISRDVSEYIRQLEDKDREAQSRRARRKGQAQPVYDDYAAEDAQAPDAQDYAGGEDVFEDIDEADFEDMRRGARFGARQIIRIVIALAVVAALVVGVVAWIRYVRDNQSSAPIEGVSETLYAQGIELVKSHVDGAYVGGLTAKYATDGMLSLSTDFTAGVNAINALMPAEPAANDQTFIDALLAIENNINNAILADAMAAGSASPDAAAASQANWQSVNASIAQLEAATSASELTGVINAQPITVQSETPAPTPEPIVYQSLSRGDSGNVVQELQERLYQLGYLNDDRDGVFGGKTQTAVKAFQENAGLNASGIADSEMQALLFSDEAPYAPGVTTPTPAPTETPAPEPTNAPIQPAEAAGADGTLAA